MRVIIGLMAFSLPMSMAIPAQVSAQDIAYNCQNEPQRLFIPAGSLPASLNKLRLATKCPIGGTDLAKGKRSHAVKGRLTPTQALRVMLAGTGLKGESIKQGLGISKR